MNSSKYIAMDVHKDSISLAVRNAAGKIVMESLIETKASMILQFIDGLRGDLHVTFEEGTSAAWLYDLLKPHVTRVVVCDPRKNKSMREGNQNDKIDARRLAELLRLNHLTPVYHGEHGLRDQRRRVDDHLSLVAGIRRLQRNQLEMWKCDTVTKLAGVPIPLKEKPLHGSRESMERVREQARVQIAGRVQQKPVHELLKIEPEIGFCRLPEPSPGDMFVDLEGDPFAGDLEAGGGHQYLFGFVTENGASAFEYQKRWSFDAQEEREAFEWLVDAIEARQSSISRPRVLADSRSKSISRRRIKEEPTPRRSPLTRRDKRSSNSHRK